MIGVEYILLMNTAVFSVMLIVLLFFASRKNKNSVENGREYLSKDLIKIKEQVSED